MAGSPQFVQGVREAASALGMDPTDLATIISYETAGTFDPAKKGPTTQWGQHKGLIQFGEPQARAHGVDWNNPEASQLGADGAIVRYFRSSGWKPGMGMLDAYSIVNAGGPGLYNRSDANNGGAPGTVADKVRTQMGGHRKNAIRLLGGSGQPPQATVSTQGAAPMMQQKEQQPRGLLEGFGVQRRDETAGGETAQPFYQRDSFKDTAALLAQGFGRMGIMGMEEIADDIAKQRTENKAKNKTIEYLRKSGRDDLADAVANNVLGARDAASMMFAKPKDERTALQKNYEFFVAQGMAPEEAMQAVRSGPIINTGDQVDAEGKLREKLMAKRGESFASYLDAGAASASAIRDLNVLQELSTYAPSGPLEGRIAEAFPEFNDVAALRQSITKRVAPTLRVEGSGATSDLEFNAMLNSLGSLRNTPEANQAIIGVMQEKARYNMQRREIINGYMTNGVTLQDTNEKLAALDASSAIPAAVESILGRYSDGETKSADSGGQAKKRLKFDPETRTFK